MFRFFGTGFTLKRFFRYTVPATMLALLAYAYFSGEIWHELADGATHRTAPTDIGRSLPPVAQDTQKPAPEIESHYAVAVDSNVWKVELPKEEKLSNPGLENSYLSYASKTGKRTTLYKRNISDGSQTKVFKFDESREAPSNGNYWAGLMPSISLSPDRSRVAFIDQEGLKTYDLKTTNIRTYFRKIRESKPDASDSDYLLPALWAMGSSSSATFEGYGFFQPQWSADGKFICVGGLYREDTGLDMFDALSGEFLQARMFGEYLAWAPSGHTFTTWWSPDSDPELAQLPQLG